MLSNEKYTGDVRLLKTSKSEVHYMATNNNPAIISKEVFEAVQIEKAQRSNMVRGGTVVVSERAKSILQKKKHRGND